MRNRVNVLMTAAALRLEPWRATLYAELLRACVPSGGECAGNTPHQFIRLRVQLRP